MGKIIGFLLLVWYYIFPIVFFGSILILSFPSILKSKRLWLKNFSLIFTVLIFCLFIYNLYFDFTENSIGFWGTINGFRDSSVYASAYILILSLLFSSIWYFYSETKK